MCTRQDDASRLLKNDVSPRGRDGDAARVEEAGAPREPVTGIYQTTWGAGAVTVQQGRLAAVDLPGEAGGVKETALACMHPDDSAAVARWTAELEAYFRGERLSFTPDEVALDELAVPEFARKVYAALLEVPAATTVAYGELAEMAGFPRAARAGGNAMAANPIPIVVPCHRVIKSDGRYGNYGKDPGYKVRLLAHEESCAAEKRGTS